MRRSTLTIASYLALVFGSGILVGAFGYRFAAVPPVSAKAPGRPSPDEWRKQYLTEMQTRLKLTSDQVSHLNTVLDETRGRFHDERSRHEGVMKAIKEQQSDKVRSMLSEDQRPEFEKLRAEREARAKASGNH